MERLIMALNNQEINRSNKLQVFLVVANEEHESYAMGILKRLRQAGIIADKDYTGRSLKAQMKYADKLEARLAVIIGDDEVKQGYFTVRNMTSKEQAKVDNEMLINAVKAILA
jgi:histidyl-tRNA synthetase